MLKTFQSLFLVFAFLLGSFAFAQDKNDDKGVGYLDIAPISQTVPADTTPPIGFPYPTLFNFYYENIGTPSINGGTVGAMYFQDKYFLNRWNSTMLYRYNGSLGGPTTLLDTAVYQGYIRDLTTDGTFLYGAGTSGGASTTIHRMNANGISQGTITSAGGVARALTYSPDENAFFVCDFSNNIGVINAATGALIRTLTGTSSLAGKYGMAYSNIPGQGAALWVWGQGTLADPYNKLWKVDPLTGATQATYAFGPLPIPSGATSPSGIAGGAEVCLISGYYVLLLNYQNYALAGYILGAQDAGVLAPFNLTAPASGTTITSIPNSSTLVTISWDTSRANATYKWIFGSPTVPPRTLTVAAPSNSYSFTLGYLDNLLAGMGVPQGGSLVGQWDVWAFRNNPPTFDSLKSANGPFNITLQRQLPPLTAFNLVSPPNNSTIVTSVFNPGPVTATWRKSGAGTTYKWKFGTGLTAEKTEAVVLSYPSNNGGFDTVLTVPNSALDGVLAGLGVAPGDSMVGQWTVYAYGGTDSLKAVETWNLTLKRQAKGDVLVAYDSSSVACRASKDSVALYLNSHGITFDLFNKGTQTSTNAISFRGYKKIVWLGEGTSVMSVVQKDSIKAYLNNPPAGQKSNLLIMSEDIGYQFGRTGSTYIDLDFFNNYLGANFVLDRPATGANQGFVGSYLNPGVTDSTVGSWPDVLSRFDPGTTHDLVKFRADGATSGVGKVGATFNVCTFPVDLESLRWSVDGSGVSPYVWRLDWALLYLNTDGALPVELSSFVSSVSGNSVILNWSTATELNNSGFQVERKSVNGEFVSVGFVRGNGTSTEEHNYIFADNGLAVGKYIYRLKQTDFDGSYHFSPIVEAEVGLPAKFELGQNYPNPFNPTTSVKFNLAVDSKVTLKIFDVIGQEVATLINTDLAAGYHSTIVDASNLSSGVYLYRLDAVGTNGQRYSSVKKMVLTK